MRYNWCLCEELLNSLSCHSCQLEMRMPGKLVLLHLLDMTGLLSKAEMASVIMSVNVTVLVPTGRYSKHYSCYLRQY